MILYNEQLKVLFDMVCKKEHLKLKYEELLEQKRILEKEVEKLKQSSLKEKSDVDRLEGGSLAAFFYHVIGKKDEKLTKEREEAYAAAVKYDAARKELVKLEAEIEAKEIEMADLHGCEQQYEEILALKKERMEHMGHWAMEKVLEYDHRVTYLDNQNREINEAIIAGEHAKEITHQVLESLEDAENWGAFDFFGGGFIADMAKYSKLDDAQHLIEELQHHLRCFKTELSDITIDSEMDVQIDGFLQFADFFFDNLFTDWSVLMRIQKSKQQVEQTENQIKKLLEELLDMRENVAKEREQTQSELDKLIVEVKV